MTNGSERAFRRNMRTIAQHVALHAGKVVLVMQPFRQLAQAGGYLLVDLERQFVVDQKENKQLFKDHIHLRPRGLESKAERIASAILEAGYLD